MFRSYFCFSGLTLDLGSAYSDLFCHGFACFPQIGTLHSHCADGADKYSVLAVFSDSHGDQTLIAAGLCNAAPSGPGTEGSAPFWSKY